MTWNLPLAAHEATIRAVPRFADSGLALRVLLNERRRWDARQRIERQRVADALATLTAPWIDELGYTRCPKCGGVMERHLDPERCTCPIPASETSAA